MPIPATAMAAYAAVAGALPSATPVLAGMAVSVGLIMSHEPGRLDAVQLTNKPEVAAECVKRNVVSVKSRSHFKTKIRGGVKCRFTSS
ncbi:MAG: hypothetical protein ACXWUK_11670 [Burkholderiales bacterium]